MLVAYPNAPFSNVAELVQYAIAKALAQPDVILRFATSGAQAKFMSAADLNAYETAETRK